MPACAISSHSMQAWRHTYYYFMQSLHCELCGRQILIMTANACMKTGRLLARVAYTATSRVAVLVAEALCVCLCAHCTSPALCTARGPDAAHGNRSRVVPHADVRSLLCIKFSALHCTGARCCSWQSVTCCSSRRCMFVALY